MKMCFNWKVLAGLGAVGAAIWVVAPGTVAAALPMLLFLACPLSMLFMMRGMGGQQAGQPVAQGAHLATAGEYTCPMHPQVWASQPGPCPTCGMSLVLAAPAQPGLSAGPEVVERRSREEQLAELRGELARIGAQQATLARQVEQLESEERPPAAGANGRTAPQAETVAPSADRRPA